MLSMRTWPARDDGQLSGDDVAEFFHRMVTQKGPLNDDDVYHEETISQILFVNGVMTDVFEHQQSQVFVMTRARLERIVMG